MNYIEKIFKRSGWFSILISLIFAVLGIILICFPTVTMTVIAYVLGIIFILIGGFRLFNYFSAKGKYDLYNTDLVFGILALVIGIITMVYSSTIIMIFRVIIGAWIIYSSLIRLNVAFKLRAQKIPTKVWGVILGLAIAMLLCGLIVIFNGGAIMMTVGIFILIYSIIDIIEEFIFLRNVKEIF